MHVQGDELVVVRIAGRDLIGSQLADRVGAVTQFAQDVFGISAVGRGRNRLISIRLWIWPRCPPENGSSSRIGARISLWPRPAQYRVLVPEHQEFGIPEDSSSQARSSNRAPQVHEARLLHRVTT
jgi:hypothetical protein